MRGPVVAQQSVCVAVWVFFVGVAGISVRINGAYITEFLLPSRELTYPQKMAF